MKSTVLQQSVKVILLQLLKGKMAAMDKTINTPVAPLPDEYYAKRKSRKAWREMPYAEKVRCVVEMQKRVAPIYASRGKIIVPWKISQ